MPIVSSFLLKIGMITESFMWILLLFKVEKNTGELKNGSRNSHSRRYCMHAHMWSFHYKIQIWNTEHIQTWRYLDDPNYTLIHFRLCGVLQLKNSLSVHFFKWVFPIFFALGIFIFSAYFQHSLENAAFGGFFFYLLKFYFWFMSLRVIYFILMKPFLC